MSVITIDATELHEAAPRIGALYATLSVAARQLRSVDVSCEMPPGVAGRVSAGVSAAARELAGAQRGMDGMDADIRERAQLAKIADAVGKIMFGLGMVKLPAELIDAAREADQTAGAAARVSARAGGIAFAIKGVLGAVGKAADVYGLLATSANPYLDDNRKAAEAVTKGGTALGTAAAIAGLVTLAGVGVVSLPAVAIGAGVALTYTVADKAFHISDHVSDGVNYVVDHADDAVEAAGQAAEDVGEGIQDVGEGIEDAAGKAKDLIGGLL